MYFTRPVKIGFKTFFNGISYFSFLNRASTAWTHTGPDKEGGEKENIIYFAEMSIACLCYLK